MDLGQSTQMEQDAHDRPLAGARVFRAPGRVNLIGEHTDYNDGFVMPAAIGFSTWVTVTPSTDHTLSIFSENFGEKVEFDLNDSDHKPGGHWSDYVLGVAVTLQQAGHRLLGATLRIRGEIPIGAGLSSSAAIEVAACYALLANSGLELSQVEIAKLCQKAENEFVGTRCGIMDQFVSCFGQAERALLLDCRSLEYQLLPLPERARIVICNSMVKHELAAGEYNVRRAQCEGGARHFAQSRPNVRALRDVTKAELQKYGTDLSEAIHRRCRHVVTENQRVRDAATALERGELETFGHLINESHSSLRDDYEVSCRELDVLVEVAQKVPGIYGSRMTGGGFGGCTVSLVEQESVEEFKRLVGQGYEKATGLAPEIYVCSASDGAGEVA